MKGFTFGAQVVAMLYVIAIALCSYFYYRPMSEPKPTLAHVRLAEADALSTKQAYLSARGWVQIPASEAPVGADGFICDWYNSDDPSVRYFVDRAVDAQEQKDKAAKRKSKHGN